MEDWNAECKLRPEPIFTLQTTTSQSIKPKDLFIRYLKKTVHGRNTSHRIREEVKTQHITNADFKRWKALITAYD